MKDDCGGWSDTGIGLCPRHCVIENVWEGKVQNPFAWAKIWFFSFSMRPLHITKHGSINLMLV
jgi:hypothetical protein